MTLLKVLSRGDAHRNKRGFMSLNPVDLISRFGFNQSSRRSERARRSADSLPNASQWVFKVNRLHLFEVKR